MTGKTPHCDHVRDIKFCGAIEFYLFCNGHGWLFEDAMQCMNEVLTGFTEIIESGKQDAGAVAWLRGIRADKKKWK